MLEVVGESTPDLYSFVYSAYAKAPGLHVLNRDAADILGSPIGNIEHVGDVILEKVAQLRLMGDRLCLLHSHDVLLLLFPSRRYCTSSGLLHVFFHLTLILMTACSDHFLVI